MFAILLAFLLGISWQARAEISSVMNLAPQTAVIEESGAKVSVKDVAINTVLSVKAGETIPLDGVVVSGSSSVDESSLTGESLPAEKEGGANVWAGTMNLTGNFAIFPFIGFNFMKIFLMTDRFQVIIEIFL